MRATINIIAAAILLLYVSLPLDAFCATTRTDAFYSELHSPLAKASISYCKGGRIIPATIDDGKISGTVACFAGGCFWGLELAYQRQLGVLATCVGYTQGTTEYPSYKEVCSEETGHTEAVLVVFDPEVVSYAKLADLLFDRIPDPTMLNRVGRDRGTQYRTGMYAHSEEQLVQAQTAFDRENQTWKTSGRPIVTEVKSADVFWPAEEVHQTYLVKGGRFGRPQSAEKGTLDEIRCYG